MSPIFRLKHTGCVGLSPIEFIDEFYQACADNLFDRRAHSFAFVFADLHRFANPQRDTFRESLQAEDGFQSLYALTGAHLTIFFIDPGHHDKITDRFNEGFLDLLGVADPIHSPCIVFLRLDGGVGKVERIDSRRLIGHATPKGVVARLQEVIGRQSPRPAKDFLIRLLRPADMPSVARLMMLLADLKTQAWRPPLRSRQ